MSNWTIGAGKDFATLQAFADYMTSIGDTSDIVATCFAGSDLGGMSFTSSWPVGFLTVIQVQTGQQHNGRDTGRVGVAYGVGDWAIQDMGFWHLTGLRVEGGMQFLYTETPDADPTILIEKVLLIRTSDQVTVNNGMLVGIVAEGTPITVNSIMRNNVALYQNYPVGDAFVNLVVDSGDAHISASVFNNTALFTGTSDNSNNRGVNFFNSDNGGGADIQVSMENNIVLRSDGGLCYNEDGFASTIIVADYNLGSDASATSTFGGTHNQNNKVPNTVVVNMLTDPRLIVGSPALNTGVTIGSFSTDVIGTSRPQGAAWDIGAFEMAGGTGFTATGGGGRFWSYRRR